MVKKILLLFLTTTITLSACGTLEVTVERTPTPVFPGMTSTPTPTDSVEPGPTYTPQDPLLSMASNPEAIQRRLLLSALNWKTIWVDGINTDLTVGGQASAHEQLWIDQSTARFRFLSGPVDGQAQTLIVSDGSSKLSMDIASGARQVSPMPQGIAGQFIPQLSSGSYLTNPIGEQTSAWARNMVFSSYWAQVPSAGFKPMGMEMVAGRQTLIVDDAALGNRMWVDTLTVVILKQQRFGVGGGSMVEEYVISKVEYDISALPDELFSVNPAWQPVFSDVMGVPPVSVTPVPAANSSDTYQVITRPNQSDGLLTDVYIRNASTKAETLLMSLPDVNSENYHAGEYHKGNLYIMRRMGNPSTDENWSDQLWRYDIHGNGKMLFSNKGLDFRVAPDESYVAVVYQSPEANANRVAFINTDGEMIQEINIDPTGNYLDSPNQWSDDSRQFWGQLQFDVTPKIIYQISISDWSVKKFIVEPLNIGGEFELNANTGKLVYSDYPFFFATDQKQLFIDSGTIVHLFLYDLNTQVLQTIATSTAMPFSPKGLDNATIEYTDPNRGAQIEYKIN